MGRGFGVAVAVVAGVRIFAFMARRMRRLYGLVGLCVCGACRIDRNGSRASGACFRESGTSWGRLMVVLFEAAGGWVV